MKRAKIRVAYWDSDVTSRFPGFPTTGGFIESEALVELSLEAVW